MTSDNFPSTSKAYYESIKSEEKAKNNADMSEQEFRKSMIDSLMNEHLTAQLVNSGTVGLAAATAVVSERGKKKKPFSFEMNPSCRKRQKNRLSKKLERYINEYAVRCGQQAVVLIVNPAEPNLNYKVYGAKPLEYVMQNLRNVIIDCLNDQLERCLPTLPEPDSDLFELPPLVIDGIPTPISKMTQAQLRAFIPLMLKYSTGRGKPGWGKESARPPWWPDYLPWANVRMDVRSDAEKEKMSWTAALREIVYSCYRYHEREDLFPSEDLETVEKPDYIKTENSSSSPENITIVFENDDTGSDEETMDQSEQNIIYYVDNNSFSGELMINEVSLENIPDEDKTQLINEIKRQHILIPYLPYVAQYSTTNYEENETPTENITSMET